MAAKKTPAWVWIGCGCMLCIGLVMAGIGGLGFFGFNMFKTMVEDMADPLARSEATMNVLGAEALPDGWHSHAFFKIPFVMEIAILTDGDNAPEAIEGSWEEKAEAMENLVLRHERLGPNTFVYMHLRGRGNEPFQEVISGQRTGSGSHVDLDIELEDTEPIGEGEFEINGQTVTWNAARGSMGTMGGSARGIYSILTITCADGEKHDGLWFQRAPVVEPSSTSAEASSMAVAEGSMSAETAPAVPSDDADSLKDTPADQEAIQRLMGHFNLC